MAKFKDSYKNNEDLIKDVMKKSKIEEGKKKNYDVYRLVNYDRKEIYHGIALNPLERLEKHIEDEVKKTKPWKFGIEKIEGPGILRYNLSQSKASELAHLFERQHPDDPDFTNLKTRGI